MTAAGISTSSFARLGGPFEPIVGVPMFHSDRCPTSYPACFNARWIAATRPEGAGPTTKRETDHRDGHHGALLRARRERPRGCRAAEQRDELAPVHSITSSAICCRCNGTLIPSVLAVLILMTSSNFVDCWIGRSAGFSPLRNRRRRRSDDANPQDWLRSSLSLQPRHARGMDRSRHRLARSQRGELFAPTKEK